MKAAAKNEWIGLEKRNKDLVLRKVKDITDELQEQLKSLENGEVKDKDITDELQEQLKILEHEERRRTWSECRNRTGVS
ncbi:hypothetical protein BRADI_4g29825v3 [Brachypodium distachyon]|uniref:Uncharacterized protein n=1 Tax=Brachypodium distachyon TaxID=15368 RepID=A0A2K2CR65_BRADI|nr:hypothetical protein BRADI_4g29825v3 [Brachypodium distachyon]